MVSCNCVTAHTACMRDFVGRGTASSSRAARLTSSCSTPLAAMQLTLVQVQRHPAETSCRHWRAYCMLHEQHVLVAFCTSTDW